MTPSQRLDAAYHHLEEAQKLLQGHPMATKGHDALLRDALVYLEWVVSRVLKAISKDVVG